MNDTAVTLLRNTFLNEQPKKSEINGQKMKSSLKSRDGDKGRIENDRKWF